MNEYVIGKLQYMLPLYTQANNNNNLNKIHKLIMRAARSTIGNNCCRFSRIKLLNICKWPTAKNMINLSATNAIHNIIINRSQNAL